MNMVPRPQRFEDHCVPSVVLLPVGTSEQEHLGHTICANGEVRHVTRMRAGRIQNAVLLATSEVTTCALEVGTVRCRERCAALGPVRQLDHHPCC